MPAKQPAKKPRGKALPRTDDDLDARSVVTEADFETAAEEEATPDMRRHAEAEPDEDAAA